MRRRRARPPRQRGPCPAGQNLLALLGARTQPKCRVLLAPSRKVVDDAQVLDLEGRRDVLVCAEGARGKGIEALHELLRRETTATVVVTHISRALKRALRRDNEYYCLTNINK